MSELFEIFFLRAPVTEQFFELQTPDFAWKFVWTEPTNYAKNVL